MNKSFILTAILSVAFLIPFLGCGDAPKTPEQLQKEQKYREVFGDDDKVIITQELVRMYEKNPLQANKNCQQKPILLDGFINDMGSNNLGNYIDLKNLIKLENTLKTTDDSDIRIFLEDSDWNREAISKIKQGNGIRIYGLCYGQTEAFGVKSKIIIGNAKILKINKEFL